MRGTVFISPIAPVPADGSMIDPSTARFIASWQDEDEAKLEDVQLDGAEAAIEWGRDRSRTVLIRLGNRGDTYFSAGSTHAEDDDGPLPVWPPATPAPGGWWQAPAVPTLLEIEHVAAEVASKRWSPDEAARWALDRVRPTLEEGAPEEIRAALQHLVELGPPGLRRFVQ